MSEGAGGAYRLNVAGVTGQCSEGLSTQDTTFLVGLTLIASMWSRRPLLALPRWRWALPRGMQIHVDAVRRATIFWSLVFFVAGVVQVAMEIGIGLSIASPAGFLNRSLAALLMEVAALVYMRRIGPGKPNLQSTGAS